MTPFLLGFGCGVAFSLFAAWAIASIWAVEQDVRDIQADEATALARTLQPPNVISIETKRGK